MRADQVALGILIIIGLGLSGAVAYMALGGLAAAPQQWVQRPDPGYRGSDDFENGIPPGTSGACVEFRGRTSCTHSMPTR